MISKEKQLEILQGLFSIPSIQVKLYDEYTDIDDIKRELEQTQAQVQANDHTGIIVGIAQSLPSQLTPVANLDSIAQTQLITFFVPNENVAEDGQLSIEARTIIQELNNKCISAAGVGGYEASIGSYIITPNLPVVGQETNALGYWAVDVSISIGWQIMKDGAISNQYVLKIDDTEAIWLDLTLNRTRIPEPVNKATDQEMKTHIIQQGLTMNVALPLQNVGVGHTLFIDSLTGAVEKAYKVEIGTKEGDVFTSIYSCKMVATQITTHFSVGLIGSISAEFSYFGGVE